MELHDQETYDPRWTRQYYHEHHRLFKKRNDSPIDLENLVLPKKTKVKGRPSGKMNDPVGLP